MTTKGGNGGADGQKEGGLAAKNKGPAYNAGEHAYSAW